MFFPLLSPFICEPSKMETIYFKLNQSDPFRNLRLANSRFLKSIFQALINGKFQINSQKETKINFQVSESKILGEIFQHKS
jgi:hypothetical protein